MGVDGVVSSVVGRLCSNKVYAQVPVQVQVQTVQIVSPTDGRTRPASTEYGCENEDSRVREGVGAGKENERTEDEYVKGWVCASVCSHPMYPGRPPTPTPFGVTWTHNVKTGVFLYNFVFGGGEK